EDGERVLAAGPAEGLSVGGRVEEVGATVGADAAVERAADRARRRLEDADHHRAPDAARALVEGSGPDDAAHAAGRHLSAARRGARAGGLGGAAGRAVIAAERLASFEATAGSARDVVAAEGDAARLGWNARGAGATSHGRARADARRDHGVDGGHLVLRIDVYRPEAGAEI